MKKLILDGKDFTNDTVFDNKITYSRTKDQVEGSKFIEKITFNNAAYDYLNEIYFKNRDRKHICKMQISPKNCDKTYNFTIGYRNVKKCFCSIEASPITDNADKYDYFKKTLWYGNGFDSAFEHFHIYFCTGFKFILLVFVLMYPLLVVFILLLNAIDSIIDIGDVPTLDDLNQVITGAGNYHLGYSLREVLEFHAPKAGLKFQSTILQSDPYANTVFMMAQANDGFDDDQNVKFDRQNAYGLSILQLMQMFKKLHNAVLWIEGDVLRYETQLVYDTTDITLVDLDESGIDLCEQFETTTGVAYGDFKYNRDSDDSDGNQAMELYSDIAEFNSPPEDWQKGYLDYLIQDFSPIRYQDDKYDQSNWSVLINDLRSILKNRTKDMLLSNSRSAQMKVIIWDGTSPRKDAWTKRWEPTNDGGHEYNYDYFINQNPLKDPLVRPNLYDRFFFYLDPRLYYPFERDDFKYAPCDFCNDIDLLETYGTRAGIKKKEDGIGLAEEITVNFDTMEIEVKKPVWKIKT